MGLFDRIKNALSGTPSPEQKAAAGKLPRTYHGYPHVRPVRAVSRRAAVRQPEPQSCGTKPYPFARRNSRNSEFLDRRVGEKIDRQRRFGLPALSTPEDLAAWLKLPLKTLAWMADFHNANAWEKAPKKQHYHYKWQKKRGNRGWRLVEAPKPLLKLVQQRILREILDKVPAHPSAHGFTKGRSIRTNAEPHIGKYVVVRCDLEHFYLSINSQRIRGLFFALGYNSEISWWLARLCTNHLPYSIQGPEGMQAWRALPTPLGRHLPQGAPTSPALANLSAWALDVRLSGLARRFSVAYTRYADDLTFSGDEKSLRGLTMAYLLAYIRGIIRDERFRFNAGKRKLIRRGGRQVVTGLTVNEKLNIPRPYFDRLKATLHNCVMHGPTSQNRENLPDFRAHLHGQIAFVRNANPQKAERLQRIFDRIAW